MYLLEDGESVIIWVGQATDPNFLGNVFGVAAFNELNGAQAAATLGTRGDPLSAKIVQILEQIRLENGAAFMQVHVVRHGEAGKELQFFGSLIEDRTAGVQTSYAEFLQRCGYRPQSQQAPGGAPPMAGAPPMGGAPPPAYR